MHLRSRSAYVLISMDKCNNNGIHFDNDKKIHIMHTDNFYTHTCSIREIRVHPVVHVVWLNTKGDIQNCISSTWLVFEKSIKDMQHFCSVRASSIFLLFLFLLKLHKTSDVVSAFCEKCIYHRPSCKKSVFLWHSPLSPDSLDFKFLAPSNPPK